jgi:LmbE family N-acetylglucosaminyl deacetylase
MRTLAIVAHPDDEVLGCGATLARLAAEGVETGIVVLGEGATSRYANRGDASAAEVEALQEQVLQAAKILGAGYVRTFGLPDNRFDSLDLLDVVKRVESAIEEFSPSCVYTHFSGDLNIDHAVTHRAVLTAARPTGSSSVLELYACEAPSSTEWACGAFSAFQPNTYVEVAGSMEKKLEAMSVYEGEGRDYPHPRSRRALKALAEKRGTEAGLEAAEAFLCIRSIKR